MELDGVRNIDVEDDENVIELCLIVPPLVACLDLDGRSSWSEVESQASSSRSSPQPQSPESDEVEVFLMLKWFDCMGSRCGRAGGAVIPPRLLVKVRSLRERFVSDTRPHVFRSWKEPTNQLLSAALCVFSLAGQVLYLGW
jgi:hypothetical protein